MSSKGSNRQTGQSFRTRYARGLRTSARNNGPAYGYSVTITATLAILSAVEVFTLAGGAIAAFTLVEAVASRGFRRRFEEEPSVVEAIGSAFAFLSVGARWPPPSSPRCWSVLTPPGRSDPSSRLWST